ncbi:hypothetical protein DVA76_18155 [Acinetobacter baumannii]|nr:hypothetical protein DVA76_18155 [Acinetobacter baumannii]
MKKRGKTYCRELKSSVDSGEIDQQKYTRETTGKWEQFWGQFERRGLIRHGRKFYVVQTVESPLHFVVRTLKI